MKYIYYICYIKIKIMKTLVSLLVVLSMSSVLNGQCLHPKKTHWDLTESLGNTDTKRGFAVVVDFPHTDYVQSKVKVNKVTQSKCNSRSDKSNYYFFDLENKMIYHYDCFGLVKSYEIKKYKHKKNFVLVTVDNGVVNKINFKITFGVQATFSEVKYYKHKKYSEIFYAKQCSYYSKP